MPTRLGTGMRVFKSVTLLLLLGVLMSAAAQERYARLRSWDGKYPTYSNAPRKFFDIPKVRAPLKAGSRSISARRGGSQTFLEMFGAGMMRRASPNIGMQRTRESAAFLNSIIGSDLTARRSVSRQSSDRFRLKVRCHEKNSNVLNL